MADATIDNTAADAAKAAADAAAKSKVYDETEFKAVVKSRDELKERIRTIEESQKKAEELKLAEQGEYKALLEKSNAELAALKPKVAEADGLRSAFDAILKAEAAGIEDVADAIISNTMLTYEERMAKVRTLKEKLLKGGTGTSAGGSGTNTGKKTYTPEEFAKLPAIERAKVLREQQGK